MMEADVQDTYWTCFLLSLIGEDPCQYSQPAIACLSGSTVMVP